MQIVAVQAALLKEFALEFGLRVNSIVAARVVDRHGDRGTLALMGAMLEAELPEGLEPGTTLKLRVEEAGAERVMLRVVDNPTAPPAAPVAIPLPDGGTAHVRVESREAADGEDGSVPQITLSYETEALGRLDLTLALPGGAVTAHVAAPAGDPFDRADSAAEALIAGLESATGRPARVTINPRQDPFETYA